MHRFLFWLVPTIDKLPRAPKFVLGDRVENTALDMLVSLLRGPAGNRLPRGLPAVSLVPMQGYRTFGSRLWRSKATDGVSFDARRGIAPMRRHMPLVDRRASDSQSQCDDRQVPVDRWFDRA